MVKRNDWYLFLFSKDSCELILFSCSLFLIDSLVESIPMVDERADSVWSLIYVWITHGINRNAKIFCIIVGGGFGDNWEAWELVICMASKRMSECIVNLILVKCLRSVVSGSCRVCRETFTEPLVLLCICACDCLELISRCIHGNGHSLK